MTTRINKSIAEDAATSLLMDAKVKLDGYKKELDDYLEKVIIKSIPKHIFDFYNSLSNSEKNFIRDSDAWYVKVAGTNYLTHTSKKYPTESSYTQYINIKEEEDKRKVDFLAKRYFSFEKEFNDTFAETVNTLVKLSSYKRVSEIFPEALPHLPKYENQKMMVSIDSVRDKIKEISL